MMILNGPTLVRYLFRSTSLTSQGAPETGDIPNAMTKPTSIEVRSESLEYAPTAGTKVLLVASSVDGDRNFAPPLRISTITSIARERRVNTLSRYTVPSFTICDHD